MSAINSVVNGWHQAILILLFARSQESEDVVALVRTRQKIRERTVIGHIQIIITSFQLEDLDLQMDYEVIFQNVNVNI